ncbi:MAG: type II toxin-antitoxin system Phd/YefM family antitoxin [Thermodesulfobacteriota bacterium]
MRTINIHEAKTHLSRIAEEVAAGEEIIVAKANRPVMRLCPIEPRAKPRVIGILKGKIHLSADFDAPLPDDVLEVFEGKSTL